MEDRMDAPSRRELKLVSDWADDIRDLEGAEAFCCEFGLLQEKSPQLIVSQLLGKMVNAVVLQ